MNESEISALLTFIQLMEFSLRFEGVADFEVGPVAEARKKCLELGIPEKVIVQYEDKLVEKICYPKNNKI